MAPPTATRRDALRVLGAAGIAALAGCTAGRDASTVTSAASDTVTTTETPAAGDVVWSATVPGGVQTDVTTDGSALYVGTDDDHVRSLDAADGSDRWSFPTDTSLTSSLDVADGTVYAAESHQLGAPPANVYAIDAASGESLWSAPIGRGGGSPPTVADGTVYVGGDAVYALDAATGEQTWRFEPEDATAFEGQPTVDGDTVYVGADGERPGLYALDAATGAAVWEYAVDHDVTSRVAVTGDSVYFGSVAGTLYALGRTSHESRWTADLGDHVSDGPVVGGGSVFVTGGRTVAALDAEDGDERWTVTVGKVYSSPVLADGTVHVGAGDATFHALAADTGDRRWTVETDAGIEGSPAVTDDAVYVGDAAGTVAAVRRRR